jgi:hypothetical protein
MRNIVPSDGLVNSRRYSVVATSERVVLVRLDDGRVKTCRHCTQESRNDAGPSCGGSAARFWDHGQLYVILCRVRDLRNLYVLLPDSKHEIEEISPYDVELGIIALGSSLQSPLTCDPPDITLAIQMIRSVKPPVVHSIQDCPDQTWRYLRSASRASFVKE